MKDLLIDIGGFLKTLTGIDLLLYLAVLFLILLVVSLIYIIKNSDDFIETKDDKDLDLKEVVTNLENTEASTISNYTPYEEEQEKRAIISYDELVRESKKNNILGEEMLGNEELSIKKIDLPRLEEDLPEIRKTEPDKVLGYEKEEEFLKSLKTFLKDLD